MKVESGTDERAGPDDMVSFLYTILRDPTISAETLMVTGGVGFPNVSRGSTIPKSMPSSL